ncbi:MAG: hypothetical protein IKO57_14090 [Treponema sp.]|nr:hypothetical protein [Treponema sp.]
MKIFQTISNYIDFFIERLIRDKKIDVPVLVICFGISCLVCFVYKMQGVEDNTFVSELTIKNEQAGFIQAGSPSTESIKIMLSGADAKSFKPTDFKPYIDLSYVSSAGKQKLPVLLHVSDDAKNAVSLQTKCEPSHVTIDVDEVVDDSILLEPVLEGKLPDGYAQKSVKVTPQYLHVRGALSKIKGKRTIRTKPIKITNARTSFKSENVGFEDTGVFYKIDDEEISVEVEIVPVKVKRHLEIVPLTYKSLNPNVQISLSSDNIALDIYGNKDIVDNFEVPQNFAVVDCSSVKHGGNFNLPLTINTPSSIELTGEYPKTVPVTFISKANQVENKTEAENASEKTASEKPNEQKAESAENSGE